MSGIGLARVALGARPLSQDAKGVNDTYIGFIDDAYGERKNAFIKDLSERQLGNELLASSLGHSLGLPLPRAYLAAGAEGVVQWRSAPVGPDGERLLFASENAGVPPIRQLITNASSDTVMQLLSQWERLAEAAVFDEWIANGDRNQGNLLYGESGFWLIDHGHAFTGPEWQIEHLMSQHVIRNQLLEIAANHLSDDGRVSFCERADRFALEVADVDVAACATDAYLDFIMEADERRAVVNFLEERKRYVEKNVRKRVGIEKLDV